MLTYIKLNFIFYTESMELRNFHVGRVEKGKMAVRLYPEVKIWFAKNLERINPYEILIKHFSDSQTINLLKPSSRLTVSSFSA